MVLAVAIPLNILLFLVITQLTTSARNAQEVGLIHSARGIAAAVDAEIGKYLALAESLSRSPDLLRDDLTTFDTEARRAFSGIDEAWILVADLGGQQLLNTAVPSGHALPHRPAAAMAAQQRAIAARAPLLTDIRIGPVTGTWVATVELPIFKNGAPFRELAVQLNMKPFLRLLGAQQIPPSWVAGIIDGEGRYIARAPGMETLVGLPASDGWRASRRKEGLSEFRSRENDLLINANSLLKLGSWAVGVAVKKSELQAAAWHSIRWSLLLGGLLSLSSLGLAWLMARRIAAPLAVLRQNVAVPASTFVPAAVGDPPEIVALSRALGNAAAEREASALRQNTLLDMTSRLIEAHRRDQLGKIVFEAVGPAHGADICFKYQFDVAAQKIHLAYHIGIPGPMVAAARTLEVGQAFCGSVAKVIQPLAADATRIASDERAAFLRQLGVTAYCCHPLRAKDGRILGTFALASTTQRRFSDADVALFATASNVLAQAVERFEADQARLEANAKFRALFEQSTIFAGVLSKDGTMLEANDMCLTGCGFDRRDVVGRPFWQCGWWHRSPELMTMVQDAIRQAAGGRRFRTVTPYHVADGSERRVELIITPVTGEDGKVLFLAATGLDITDRERLQGSLRQAHDTFRHLVDHSPFGIYAIDADFRLSQVSAGAQKVFANVRPLLGRDLAEVLHFLWPEPFANEAISRFRHTLETGEPYRASRTIEKRRDTDDVEAYDWKLERVILPDGRPGVVCHFYDLSERQRHESELHTAHTRQKVLMRELAHRGKNLIAVIQAIANRSFSKDRPIDEARSVFSGRLMALADTFGRLTEDAAETSSLEAIVRSGVQAFSDRVDIDGPAVKVPARVAQTFALVVHELATNAAKYGALTVSGGRVAVSWKVTGTNGKARFSFAWRETGRPDLPRPTRIGFGTTLITTIAGSEFGCQPSVDFGGQGLCYHFETALTAIGEVDFSEKAPAASSAGPHAPASGPTPPLPQRPDAEMLAH